ncbi:NUDIX domain-containing protein [Patescibacteria group bacterium]|nr:NUDIX domain-containing protein [Patescibacteria group bacterium]MBU1721952.1 NUDIX domain-containing protein [Patescibacteria group bacterium]MBU1901773.1 NUDIX domain-containing protein [Patescibacteria group bacterium]
MAKTYHKNIPASYLILMKDNQVLLLRRFNTGYGDGNYSLPAGHVDPGETFTQCIMREGLEEIGVTIHQQQLSLSHIMHRNNPMKKNDERIDAFFIAKKWEGEIENKEPHKCDDLSWFSLDDLPENILPYVKKVLGYINQGVFYSEFGWE